MKENNVVNERMDINDDEASVEWIKPVYTGPNFILSAKVKIIKLKKKKFYTNYKVTHKGWDYKRDCTEFNRSFITLV